MLDQRDLYILLYLTVCVSVLAGCAWGLLCTFGFFKCFRGEHSMHLDDMGHRDDTGWLNWPCQRCGAVQRVEYGLAVRGEITQIRLTTKKNLSLKDKP